MFLLFLLDGLWPVGAVVDVVEEAVDVLYGTQLLTAQRPLCIFCAAASYLCIITKPKLNSLAQTSNSKIIAFSFYTYLVAKTQIQPTTLVRIRPWTVLHHYLHTIDSFFLRYAKNANSPLSPRRSLQYVYSFSS